MPSQQYQTKLFLLFQFQFQDQKFVITNINSKINIIL